MEEKDIKLISNAIVNIIDEQEMKKKQYTYVRKIE